MSAEKTPQAPAKDHLARPGHVSRRSSTMSIAQLDRILTEDELDMDTYGVSELRDGLFDAVFTRPNAMYSETLEAEHLLPAETNTSRYTSPKELAFMQLRQLHSLVTRISTTRDGIRFAKTFIAFSAAYILCLVPVTREWLGRYHYMMAISVILNHPARTIGAQIEGTILVVAGIATGLGWGAIGLLVSTSTLTASAGYGGILAMFLALFMLTMAWIRSFFIRFYQFVLCAGISILFTTLAETNSQNVTWLKLRTFALPWLFGQAIALVVNCALYPDAGSRAIACVLHNAFNELDEVLTFEPASRRRLKRQLARSFVDLSETHREMRIEITLCRYGPQQVELLRNNMQAVIRAFLSLCTRNESFSSYASMTASGSSPADHDVRIVLSGAEVDEQDDKRLEPSEQFMQDLRDPTMSLISCITDSLKCCHAALMDLSGHRKHLGPRLDIGSDVGASQVRIKHARATFDVVISNLLESHGSNNVLSENSQVVEAFVFARLVREAIDPVEVLIAQVDSMQRESNWPRVYVPSYPLSKAIHQTNAQVRHDRGGEVAGSSQVTFTHISQAFSKIKLREHKPMSQASNRTDMDVNTDTSAKDTASQPKKKRKLRYRVWMFLYRLQGFESRYTFKVCLVLSLLSVPSYLAQAQAWWDQYEAWWAVVMAWAVMHPRVGGNVQDLCTRSFFAIFGAVWSGIAYAAGQGSPYVMAVFAAIYMLPMLYRYTISSHPRSGLAGCISFTVVSLGLQSNGGGSSPANLAALKGVAFLIGTAAPIIVNWILWPFIARHELRNSLSSIVFFMSIAYRSILAKYVYFQDGGAPTAEDITKSEILEGRLREGFVRSLTRHEIRLRSPFDPLPYAALADACESFFDHLIAVRQSALFYNPSFIRDDPQRAERLLCYRRDAVAVIIGNLYILSGALRSQRKVPRYLPSAAAARRRLLLKTAELEDMVVQQAPAEAVDNQKRWKDVYSYSYNASLTGCVAQLEAMEKYTKLIVGEQGFDDEFHD